MTLGSSAGALDGAQLDWAMGICGLSRRSSMCVSYCWWLGLPRGRGPPALYAYQPLVEFLRGRNGGRFTLNLDLRSVSSWSFAVLAGLSPSAFGPSFLTICLGGTVKAAPASA